MVFSPLARWKARRNRAFINPGRISDDRWTWIKNQLTVGTLSDLGAQDTSRVGRKDLRDGGIERVVLAGLVVGVDGRSTTFMISSQYGELRSGVSRLTSNPMGLAALLHQLENKGIPAGDGPLLETTALDLLGAVVQRAVGHLGHHGLALGDLGRNVMARVGRGEAGCQEAGEEGCQLHFGGGSGGSIFLRKGDSG